MKIINATDSTQTFSLSTGYQIHIKPGTASEIFLGDETIVSSILRSGLSCEQIGIVVGSSSEYEICRKAIPAGINQISKSGDVVNYVYTDEAVAKAKLLEGKDFTPSVTSPNAILDLQMKIDKKEEEITKLKKKVKELKVEADQAKASVEPLEKANAELNQQLIKIKGDNEEVNEANISLRDKLQEVNKQNKDLLEVKSGYEKVIKEKTDNISLIEKNMELLKTEGKKCLERNEELSKILNDIVKTYNLVEVEKGKWRMKDKED